MRRPDYLRRIASFAAGVAWVFLALISTGAHASGLGSQEMRVESATMAEIQRMPAAMDCMPCALCFVAPAPAQPTSAVDAKDAVASIPPAPTPAAAPVVPFLAKSIRREHVPIRIAFCRWLD